MGLCGVLRGCKALRGPEGMGGFVSPEGAKRGWRARRGPEGMGLHGTLSALRARGHHGALRGRRRPALPSGDGVFMWPWGGNPEVAARGCGASPWCCVTTAGGEAERG